ncbi:MAG: AzlC family ABC transporter permease, partial [Oscillospiraceae bacterium]|nr:AzlC family ABC transporter permease [Oscillospiraceae bacterium]
MRRRALAAAFPHTIPVLTGYAFLGVAYGIYMRVSGFPFWYPTLSSVVIFGGSLEFVLVSMLMSSFAPLQTFLMALMIQARHLFYGIALLEKYRYLGKMRFYLIFGMTDESFSVNCSAEIPDGVDEGWFYFFVTLLDHCYWVTACTVGGLLGSLISFDTRGLDFVMTAMFVV